MQTTADRWRIIGQVVLGLGLAFLFFYTMAPFMVVLFIAAIIGILCEPFHRRLSRWIPLPLSGLLVTLGVTLVFLAPLTLVGISVSYRLMGLLRSIKVPEISELANLREHPVVLRLIHRIPDWVPVDRQWLQEQALYVAQRVLEKITQLTGIFLGQLPGILLGSLVITIAAYFFIVDGKQFVSFLSRLSPLPKDKSRQLFDAFASSCRGVVLGLLASSLIQGLLIWITFSATDVPNPILWGGIGIIMGMVPVIGVTPVILGGILYQFAMSQVGYAVGVIVGGIVTVSADNVVRPLILKGHGAMHPLLGLVSAFGAVSVLGPTGIILGPVIAAVFVAFLEILSSDLKPPPENINA